MLARGIYPPPSQFEAWFLSAAHTDRHVKQTIGRRAAAMKAVARTFKPSEVRVRAGRAWSTCIRLRRPARRTSHWFVSGRY